MYKRIVVPLDGSEIADTALEHAKSLAKLYQIPIKIVRAVDPPLVDQVIVIGMRPAFDQVEGVMVKAGDDATNSVDRHVQRLKQEGFQATGDVVWGPAAVTVASTLADGDVLVMTSRGRTGASRWFIGSVAEDILKRTKVPVLLIRNE